MAYIDYYYPTRAKAAAALKVMKSKGVLNKLRWEYGVKKIRDKYVISYTFSKYETGSLVKRKK